jgi:hypothetical protein
MVPEGMAINTRWLLQEFIWGGIEVSKYDDDFPWQHHMLSERIEVLEKPELVPFSRTLIEFHSNIFACLAVSLQEVVHSARTEKAEVVEASVILGGPNEHPQECPSDASASRGDGPRRC